MLNPNRLITVAEAWAAIYWHFEIGQVAVRSRLKSQRISLARSIWWRLVYRGTHMSLPEIGEAMGRRHTTALYAIRRLEADAESRVLADRLESWIFEQREAVAV